MERMQIWLDTLKANLGIILMTELVGVDFYILSGVAAGCLIIFGKLIASALVDSKQNIMLVFIGMLVPTVFLVLGLTTADIYIVHHLENETLQIVVKLASGIGLLLLIGVQLGKIFLDVSWGKTLAAIILTYAITFAGLFLTQSGLEAFSIGARSVDKHQEKRIQE